MDVYDQQTLSGRQALAAVDDFLAQQDQNECAAHLDDPQPLY